MNRKTITRKFEKENERLENRHETKAYLVVFDEVTKYLPLNIAECFSNLQAIHVVEKDLQRIDGNSFKNLTALKIIQLNGNKISHLPDDTFSNLPELMVLILRSNNIKQINFEVFRVNRKLKWIAVDIDLVYSAIEDESRKFIYTVAAFVYLIIDLTVAIGLICYRIKANVP